MQKSIEYKNIKKYVQIDACEDCPFFVWQEIYSDKAIYDKCLVEGFCDLALKEIRIKSAAYPRWCPAKKSINDKNKEWERDNGKDSIHSIFA